MSGAEVFVIGLGVLLIGSAVFLIPCGLSLLTKVQKIEKFDRMLSACSDDADFDTFIREMIKHSDDLYVHLAKVAGEQRRIVRAKEERADRLQEQLIEINDLHIAGLKAQIAKK